MPPRVPAAFRPSAFASRVVLRPLRNWAFLTVGLPSPRDSTAPDLIGVVTFRLPETRPGRAPSQPRERRYPCDRQDATGRLLPLHNGQLLLPRYGNRLAGLTLTRRRQGFNRVRPFGLLLACGSRTEHDPLGLNPELRTPPLPAEHVRAETGLGH